VAVGDGPVRCPRHVEAAGRRMDQAASGRGDQEMRRGGRVEATAVAKTGFQNSEVLCATALLGMRADLGRRV
jgi:hypothetical protein